MLKPQHKKALDRMHADLKIFEGDIISMQVINGEGPVFDDLINNVKDTMSTINRIMSKINFNG